jgi:glycosyltransferase involved in cell wall biosynthesis
MRVLITVPSLDRDFGGPAVKAPQLTAALRSAGVDIRLAGCSRIRRRDSSDMMIALPVALRFRTTPIPTAVGPLTRRVASSDVVHVLGFRDPVGTVTAMAAVRAGVPFVLEPVGMHRSRLRSVTLKHAFDAVVGRRVVDHAALIIATSQLEATELMSDGVKASRIRVRPNGVQVDDLVPLPSRGSFRRLLRIPDADTLVLSLGRISQKKGLLDLAAAVSPYAGIQCVIAGPDERDGTLDRLVALARSERLDGRVHVMPRPVWGHEKAALLADADMFALPSASENFGIAALEAAAVGLPVVVSDRTGAHEWLPETSTKIIPYGDRMQLGAAISEIARDPDFTMQARDAASSLRDAMSWSSLADQQMAIYQEVSSA